MPGFDGIGQMGQGPMTGSGRGYCAVHLTSSRQPFVGRGRGRGWYGRGRGWRNRDWATCLPGWVRAGYTPDVYPHPSEVTPKQEMDMLKQEAENLKSQLEDIQNRIETLEKFEKTDNADK